MACSVAQALGVGGGSLRNVAFLRSRLRGDYAVDEFGFDPEFTTKIFLPLLRPLVQSWFRVEVRGAENLPADGAALLVSNHAGTMPLDGMILHAVVYDEIRRHVRMLGADLIFKTPYSHDLARKTGTTLACQEDAERLLAADQLVAVFPGGLQGTRQARTPTATSCSGSVAAVSSRLPSAPRCRSSRSPSSGRRRSSRCCRRLPRWPGRSACRTSR